MKMFTENHFMEFVPAFDTFLWFKQLFRKSQEILNIVSKAVDEVKFPESNEGTLQEKINQWQRGKTRPEILRWFWTNL
jgi:hypothetical protein